MRLPPYVLPKKLASGVVAFYWNAPTRDRKRAAAAGVTFPFRSVRLGIAGEIAQSELDRLAGEQLDALKAWRARLQGEDTSKAALGQHGTVRWFVETNLRSPEVRERAGENARADYPRIFRFV